MNEVIEVEKNEVQPVEKPSRYLDVSVIKEQVTAIHNLMKDLMKEGEHYGTLPGTKKPTLYKSGAELLSVMFQLRPEYTIKKEILEDGHINYEVTCNLFNKVTGQPLGSGVGSCSTMESKFRYRMEMAKCLNPKCGKAAIIKGKKEYGGGWICWAKKGGCGTKYDDTYNFEPKKIENADIADQWNTVLKIGKKRSFTDSILTATSASDVFTTDLEDLKENADISQQKKSEMKPDDFPDFIKEPVRKLGWNFGKLKEVWQGHKGDIRTVKKVILFEMFPDAITNCYNEELDDIWISLENSEWDQMQIDAVTNGLLEGK